MGGHSTSGVFGYGFKTLVPNLTSSILRTSYFVVSLKNWTVYFAGGAGGWVAVLCCFHSSSPSPGLFLHPWDTKRKRPKGLNSGKCAKKPRHLCLISGEEARGTGEVEKEWVVLTRKIFWIVACRVDFRGARLCYQGKRWGSAYIKTQEPQWWGQKDGRDQYAVTQNGWETWLCSKQKRSRTQLEEVLLCLDPFFSPPVILVFWKTGTALLTNVLLKQNLAFHRLSKDNWEKKRDRIVLVC